ncbi:MAG: alpha/beta hydrolase [Chloroflexi bacterium]|nr:alpha/beta hydrolase [Chloroflexota bacterium]
MIWTEGYSEIDQHRVYHQEWAVDDRPQARVLLVHGLGEHSGRYQHVGEFFTGAGINLTGFDLLGHGKSDGQRGHAESFDVFCREIDFFLNDLASREPKIPVFLYGHSLGGLITLYYSLLRKPQNIKGVVCTSPGLKPGYPIPAWKTFIGNLLYKIAPRFTMDNGLPLEYISHDKNIVAAYKADPLNHPGISARRGMDLIRNGLIVSSKAHEMMLPLLLMVGSADQLVDPQAVIEFGTKSNHNTTLKVWDDGFHELHNETFKTEVLITITDWIKQTASG